MINLIQSRAMDFVRPLAVRLAATRPIIAESCVIRWAGMPDALDRGPAVRGFIIEPTLAPTRQADQDDGTVGAPLFALTLSKTSPGRAATIVQMSDSNKTSDLRPATPAGLIADQPITATTRAALLGHNGAIIWLTGLSGSGKSTLAVALEKILFRNNVLPVVLDGDVLRTGLSRGLGFSDVDRKENIRRAAEAALLLAEAGAVVVTALISPFREDRQHIIDRSKVRGVAFAEVFVNAPLSECERRDPKQLYQRARAGLIPAFTGIDSPYEPPLAPALELRTHLESVEESLEKLTALALRLARPSEPVAGAHGAQC
jgi:adenylyl-sulfate kinase